MLQGDLMTTNQALARLTKGEILLLGLMTDGRPMALVVFDRDQQDLVFRLTEAGSRHSVADLLAVCRPWPLI